MVSMKVAMENAHEMLHDYHVLTVPPELFELEELLQAESPNTQMIANVIARHPNMLGKFLSVANQALNRSEDNLIIDPKTAVMLLGVDEVHALFVASYLAKQLPASDIDNKIIQRNVRAGIVAAELSYWVQEVNRSEAYLVSFMQDVGAIYMLRLGAENYAEKFINVQMDRPRHGYLVELENFQTSHAHIGSIIASRWRLNKFLTKTILLHHEDIFESVESYDIKVAKMIALIQLANSIVFEVFSDHFMTSEMKKNAEHAVAYLGLNDNALEAAKAALLKWGNSDNLPYFSH
jgi:HD-like signal output (HDOD) protein